MKIKENYAAIERTVALVKEKFGADSKIAVMFEKCISNTLQTTIKIKENDTVFVITGDIPAMWLRDSACQLRPFLLFAKEEPELVELVCGLIQKTNAVHSFRLHMPMHLMKMATDSAGIMTRRI